MAQKTGTQAPRLDGVHPADPTERDGAEITAHERFDRARFVGVDVSGRDLTGVDFTDCVFEDLLAHETNFRGAAFIDTTLSRVNSPSLKAHRTRFRSVEIDGSRFGSADFVEANWQSVQISNSKLGYVNLRGAELRDVLITDCSIDELDLSGAKVTRLAFVNTTVGTLELTNSRLQHVDFRELEMRRIVGVEGLRGSTLSSYQASDFSGIFAQHLGIVLEG
ncbi:MULTISPECIES: pentapeptide repeat-containing protein [unclassified Leucobacter]|uniref:pentapeptide repeat-containing protein n=1 Tax=unclassified Leucobacter TaxID=2621730 RepID=UPI00165D5BB6|nr:MULTISPECIES: pentapeptide repeat-containing protein [unclassified Leucobacter]MBC9935551.1 pentapeptide repeat-containing protein [Leucobacter sp. cx-87]